MAPETAVITAASVVFICLVWMVVKLACHFAAPQVIPVTAEWLDELCIDATNLVRMPYKEGLLRTNPDFSPKMATKLPIQECRILQEHLRHLEDDFKLICVALKVMIVQSQQDRPDLACVLLRSQMTFAYHMMMARLRLAWGR